MLINWKCHPERSEGSGSIDRDASLLLALGDCFDVRVKKVMSIMHRVCDHSEILT